MGPDADPDEFWVRVSTNLSAGRLRLVFVADNIPRELQRVVEFLNGQMSPAEVIAIEISQYVGQDLRALVPRTIGQTAVAEQRKSGAIRSERTIGSEAEYFADLRTKQPPAVQRAMESVREWARNKLPQFAWRKTSKLQSFWPCLDQNGENYGPIAFRTNGMLEVMLYRLGLKWPFDDDARRLEFVRRLNRVPGFNLSEIDTRGLPNVPLTTLTNPDSLALFLEALDWLVQEIHTTPQFPPEDDVSSRDT